MTYFLLHCHSTFIRLFLSGPCVYSMSSSHPYFCIQCLIIGITCTCTITVYINKYISYNIIELSVRLLPAVTITWHLVHRLHQRPDFNSYNPAWHVVIKLLLVDLWLRHANSCSTGAGPFGRAKVKFTPPDKSLLWPQCEGRPVTPCLSLTVTSCLWRFEVQRREVAEDNPDQWATGRDVK